MNKYALVAVLAWTSSISVQASIFDTFQEKVKDMGNKVGSLFGEATTIFTESDIPGITKKSPKKVRTSATTLEELHASFKEAKTNHNDTRMESVFNNYATEFLEFKSLLRDMDSLSSEQLALPFFQDKYNDMQELVAKLASRSDLEDALNASIDRFYAANAADNRKGMEDAISRFKQQLRDFKNTNPNESVVASYEKTLWTMESEVS